MSWITNILEDDLFVCTAEDGKTYNVTGQQFKKLLSSSAGNMPWDCWTRGPILHILNIRGTTADLSVGTCHAFTYPDGEYLGLTRNIPSETGEEFILLASGKSLNSFFGYNWDGHDWDFGPLTDTSMVENFDSVFSYCYDFTSTTLIDYFSLCNANNTYDMITSAGSSWTSTELNKLNIPMHNEISNDRDSWYDWSDKTTPVLGSAPVYGSITACDNLKPWERANAKGRIFHLINRTGTTSISHSYMGRGTVYDMTGAPLPSDEGMIEIPDDNQDYVVIITGSNDEAKALFESSSGNWDFGPLTDTSGIKTFESMFDYCMNLTTTTIAETFNFNNATNVKYMLDNFGGGEIESNADEIYMPLLTSDADGASGWSGFSKQPKWGKGEPGKPAWETWKICDRWDQDRAILHIKITQSGALYFYTYSGKSKKLHVLDMDGNLLTYGDFIQGEVGDEFVILWDDESMKNALEGSTADWDFGPLTDTSTITSFESMFDYCMSFTSESVADTFDFTMATNVKNMFNTFGGFTATNFGTLYIPGVPSVNDENAAGWDTYGTQPIFGEYPPCP
jgi:hypothetical protein